MSGLTLTYLFVLGAIIGSFLNVVSFRYTPGNKIIFTKKIHGRSECQNCKHTLSWYELIPFVSFLFQGFKCRHCAHALSWQYPSIEFVTGLATAGIPAFLMTFFDVGRFAGDTATLTWFYVFVALWVLVTYVCITIAIIDFRHQIIPDQSNLLIGALGISAFLIKMNNPELFRYNGSFTKNYINVFGLDASLWMGLLAAVGAALLIFGGIILLTKGKGMGGGDLKLALALAPLMAWPDAALVFAFAFITGSIAGIFLLLKKQKSMKSAIPFGPFIILAVYITMLYSEPILGWYFSLLT